jgi:ribonuclease P protein component
VAVVVAKYGHTVVKRNQLRRRLRELVRVLLIPKLSGLDLVIRALPSAYAADFKELAAEVERIQLKLTAESSIA